MLRVALSMVGIVAVAGWTLSLAGCNPPAPAPTTPSAQQSGGDEHAHGEEGHVHVEGDEHAGHEHPSEGPHHGHLIELGAEEYHAELAHDDVTQTVSIYILDSHAEKAVAIDQAEVTINLTIDGAPQQFKLAAAPEADDPAGQASRFESSDKALFEALESGEFKGRLNVTIADKPYAGQIEHFAHEHE